MFFLFIKGSDFLIKKQASREEIKILISLLLLLQPENEKIDLFCGESKIEIKKISRIDQVPTRKKTLRVERRTIIKIKSIICVFFFSSCYCYLRIEMCCCQEHIFIYTHKSSSLNYHFSLMVSFFSCFIYLF